MGFFAKFALVFWGLGLPFFCYAVTDLVELTNGKSSFRDLGDDFSVSFPVRRVPGARLVLFNARVAEKMGLDLSDLKKIEKQILALCAVTTENAEGSKRQMFATRYLDYPWSDLPQQGNPAGDGRLAWAGELQLKRPDGKNEYLDITLKGIGRTPLARRILRRGLFGKGEIKNLQYSDGLQTMEEAAKSFITSDLLERNGLDAVMDLAVIEIPTEKVNPVTKKLEKAAITIRVGGQTRKGHLEYFSDNKEQFNKLYDYVIKRDLGLPLETKLSPELALKHFEQFVATIAKSAAQFSDLNFVHGSLTRGNRTTRGFPLDFGTFFAQDAHHGEDTYLSGKLKVGEQARTIHNHYVWSLYNDLFHASSYPGFEDLSPRIHTDNYWKVHDEVLGQLRLKRLGLSLSQIEGLNPELKREFYEITQKLFEARGKREKLFSFYRTAAFDLRDILGKSIETMALPENERKQAWEALFLTKRKWGSLTALDLRKRSRNGKLMAQYTDVVQRIHGKLLESGADLKEIVENAHRIQRHVRRDTPFPDISVLLKNIARTERSFRDNSLQAYALGNLLVDWEFPTRMPSHSCRERFTVIATQ